MYISVIVTCYNLEKYIAEAINSVIAQDYDPSLYEIIVVDDCSTDNSAEVVKSFPEVRYFNTQSNQGVLLATLSGIQYAKGEIIAFLDGDDIWETSKLSTVVGRFKDDPLLAFITHDLKYINSRGLEIDKNSQSENVMASVPLSCESIVTRNGILLHSNYVWLGSAYAIHRTLGDVEGFCAFAKALPDPLNTYQDWPLAFWVACQPRVSFGYVHKKLFSYRLHGANHSGDATSVAKAIRNVRRTYNTMQAIKEIAISFCADPQVQKATDQKLAYYKYLNDLYGGYRLRTAKGFLMNIPYLIAGTLSFWKEAARFVGIQLFGVERFISLASSNKPRFGS